MANSIAKNLLALKEKSFDINFDLEGTDYKAIETIGSGAYGVVCSALHKSTNAKVAIKKIPSIFELTQIAMRTYREMKILRHFKHDNIISIREILARGLKEGSSDHRFQDIYIVLDLMESDLHRIIHSSQPLTEEHTRYFLYQLLRGLKYIHSANVVHRDLKPSNLLVNENCDLKIGDFGMARGIACDTNEQDAMMTQYVATRWYRAPEIMLIPTAYNAAIDMWSVGCVFAEMLGRRQIFPGHTHRDQLNLIIGILGSPSTDFIQKTHSEMVRNYIRGLGEKKPESLEKLYPRASSSALSLLQSMLVIDPTNRISAENALRQPFLSKYHDEDDEPFCIPLFNFDFEKEAMDKEKLRLAITKEVLSFSCKKTDKETPMIFNFKPVPKSELEKSRGGNHSAKPLVPVVGSFKMAPVSAASQKQLHQTNDKPSNSTNLFQNLKQDLLQGSQAGNQKSLSGAKNSLKDALLPLHTEMQDTNLFVRSSTDVEAITVSVKMDSKNDVDMASAKGEEDGKALLVDTKTRNSEDVEMLSAQAVAARHIEKTASDPVDTKALIKAALLSTRRKQLLESQTENARPVTALQRQREREEKRRKKKERSSARKKKDVIKDVNKPSRRQLLPLTDEDKSLLERWKNMQGPAAAAVTTATSTSTVSLPTNLNAHSDPPQFPIPTTQPVAAIISDTQKGVNVSVSSGVDSGMFLTNPRQGIVDSSCTVESRPSMILPTRQFGVPPEPAKDPYGIFVGLPSDGGVMSGDRNPLSPLTNVSLPGAVGSSEMGPFSQSVSQHLYPALPVVVAGFNQNQIEPPSVGCIPSLVPLTQTPSTSAEQDDLPPPQLQQNYISSKPLLPSDHQAAPIPEFLSSISTPMVKLVTLPEEIHTEKLPDNSRVGTGHSNPDYLSVLTRQLMRSHVEDLTLAHTPKGTGGGYGVGLDFHVEGFSGRCLQENSGVRQDSAPLSASLISDWLDVAGNLDANDLEALQHELELNSPAINQILDFNALPDP